MKDVTTFGCCCLKGSTTIHNVTAVARVYPHFRSQPRLALARNSIAHVQRKTVNNRGVGIRKIFQFPHTSFNARMPAFRFEIWTSSCIATVRNTISVGDLLIAQTHVDFPCVVETFKKFPYNKLVSQNFQVPYI